MSEQINILIAAGLLPAFIFMMPNQEKLLKLEIVRLNATDIQLIYSPESIYEFELINRKLDCRTKDLDAFATLEALEKLPNNAGSDAFWTVVVDEIRKKPST